MKQFLKFTGFAVLSAAVAMAQSSTGTSTQQNPPQGGASQSQGAIPSNPGQAQQPAAPTGPKAPQAKTQEEHSAYVAAVQDPDPAATLTAADEFAKKFPESELKAPLYSAAMQKAFNVGKNDGTIEAANKVLALQPEHTMALVMWATATAESTKKSDLDSKEKWDESMKVAEKAIATIDKGMPLVAPQAPADQVAAARAVLLSMAHSAMGYVTMQREDWVAAEKHFSNAVKEAGQQADPVNYLRLAVAQDNLKKYKEGLVNAQKAIEIAEAQQNTQIANMARNEKARLEKLAGGK